MVNTTDGTKMPYTMADLKCYSMFDQHFEKDQKLGAGSDGDVTCYKHRRNGDVIAVKTQKQNSKEAKWIILDEIEHLKIVGNHKHIVGSIAYYADFCSSTGVGPAILLELCDLGDLNNYVELWQEQQTEKGLSLRMPEATVWKLLRDISLGLSHIHNGLSTCFVHMDLKPENILALTPPSYTGDNVTSEPIFKITDFARMTPFPPQPHKFPDYFRGTYSYAAPFEERISPIKPSVDMYSLGATIQRFALDIPPTESRHAFVEARQRQNKPFPHCDSDWNKDGWRARRQVVFRPLNVPAADLVASWDVPNLEHVKHHKPYSDLLNLWYTQLFADPKARVTSAHLAVYVVPMIDEILAVARCEARAEQAFEKAARIRTEIGARCNGTE